MNMLATVILPKTNIKNRKDVKTVDESNFHYNY